MWFLFLLLSATPITAKIGTIHVAKGSPKQVDILLLEGENSTTLDGDKVVELRRLGAAKVEVLGRLEDKHLWVQEYRIIEIAGGRPLVGTLVKLKEQMLGLQDSADASVIVLNIPTRTKVRLLQDVGSKVWVVGNKLISGELQVARYGVLRKEEERHE